jgi:hypothetical protein
MQLPKPKPLRRLSLILRLIIQMHPILQASLKLPIQLSHILMIFDNCMPLQLLLLIQLLFIIMPIPKMIITTNMHQNMIYQSRQCFLLFVMNG